ncbi:pentapeptide repeat-containing protein [Leptospira kanakyensis]|uniref:pentapeptide repeat-containing protein n=1 Tax=Leptospira kanakyensis TaxID=2484968 RepID=UPI00223E522B|nr:pentapeptide repeat-containing protein [Leptospira kanakyensis]MCW7480577.1 pentapeptide repeat-containing protein [Leptospira kanakyensis]
MKEEIQKILQMVKENKISEAQGAELISELSQVSQETDEDKTKPWSFRSIGEQFIKFSNDVEGLYASDLKDNNMSMSRVQIPKGDRFQFKNNTIRMSAMEQVVLDDSDFMRNTISKSNLHALKVARGSFQNSELSASNLEHLQIDDGHFDTVEVHSSHLKKVEVISSNVTNSHFTAASVKDLVIHDGSDLSACSFEGAQLSHIEVSTSQLIGMELQASRLQHIRFMNTTTDQLVARFMKFDHTSFENCTLSDVLFTASEGWRKVGFDQVNFENVKLNKALFGECDLKRVTIKNVDLSEIRVMNQKLTDVTIDGNAEFCKVFGIVSNPMTAVS